MGGRVGNKFVYRASFVDEAKYRSVSGDLRLAPMGSPASFRYRSAHGVALLLGDGDLMPSIGRRAKMFEANGGPGKAGCNRGECVEGVWCAGAA